MSDKRPTNFWEWLDKHTDDLLFMGLMLSIFAGCLYLITHIGGK